VPIALASTLAVAAVAGALAGCCLPLPIYRLGTTDQPCAGRRIAARVPGCDHPIPAGIRGWLRLGSSCPRCGQRLGPTTTATALASAATTATLTLRFLHNPALPTLLASGLMAVTAAFVDLRCHRLPDRVVLPSAALGALTITTIGFAHGDQHRTIRAFASCLAVGIVLLLLAAGTHAIGPGDVNATAWIAMLAGWHSPTAVAIATVGPFLLQAPIALSLLAVRRVNRRSTLPLGPAILLAGLVSLTLTSTG
jgi:leader peptidase (prepilin peptidase)/N-methyltransferase